MANNTEVLLKRFLKRKVKITTALVTVFMITGTMSMSEIISKPYDYEKKEYNLDSNGIEKGVYNFTNKDKTILNFSNKGLYVKNSSGIGKPQIQFYGSGELLAEKDSDNAIKSEKEWMVIKTLEDDKDLKIDSKGYKVKNAIEVNGRGDVAISDFRNVEIGNSKGTDSAYETNINVNNGSAIIEAKEKISLKDAKTGAYVNGKGSSLRLSSKEIEITAAGDEKSAKEHGFGVRATEESKITLYGENIKITGNKKDNKYFNKNGGILADRGGNVDIFGRESIKIDGYRGIDTKTGSVKIRNVNGDININSQIEGIYSGRFDNLDFENGVDLKSGKGNINITSNEIGIYASNQTGRTTDVSLEAENIKIKDNKNKGIVSKGANVVLKAAEKIVVEAPTHALLAEGNSKGTTPNIFIEGKDIILKSIEEDSEQVIYGTDRGIIILNSENIEIQGKKDGITAENGSNINLTADGKISILGDIISNKKSNINIKKSNKIKSGNVEIALEPDEIKNYRENKFIPSKYNWALISSENESRIELDLKGKNEKGIGSLFIGQVRDNIGTSQEGKIILNMDKDSVWVPRNSNSITNLNLNGGKIDLAADKISKVHIKDLKGEGIFNVYVNTKNKDQGNMLYVQNFISENGKEISENKLNLQDIDLKALEKGEKVRFATLSKNAKGKVTFKDTVIEERGIQDVGVKVNKEAFDINDEQNKNYTDKNIFNDKYNLKNYKDGENWYITKEYEIIPGIPLVPAPKPQEPEIKPPAEDENKQPEINPPVDKPENKPEIKPPAEDENKQPEINPPVDKPENKPEIKPPAENQNNQSEIVPPINKPEKPNRDNDITKSVIEMSKANYASAVYMDNLNKRLGDITFAEGQDGIWVRLRNDRAGENNEYRLRNYITQVGYDKVYSVQNGTAHRGASVDYTKGGMDYKNITGNSHIDKYIISAYDTKMFNDGVYTDIVARAGYMKSDFDITTSKHKYQVRGDYSNIILGLSAEAGQKFTISEKTYFEPQVQLQYTYIGETNYTTSQGTKVELEEINSLIGRVGFRLGHDFYKENKKDNTIYLKTNLNYEMLGEQKVKASDLTGKINRKYENNVMWIDLGVGAAKDITEDLNLYTDIEKQFGESKDNNSWQINAGFRYKFDI